MPRRARLILPDIPLHIIQGGNNRHACFFADGDRSVYLDWLGEYASKTGFQVHSYMLMTNHVHLLISAGSGRGARVVNESVGKIRTIMQNADKSVTDFKRDGKPWSVPDLRGYKAPIVLVISFCDARSCWRDRVDGKVSRWIK